MKSKAAPYLVIMAILAIIISFTLRAFSEEVSRISKEEVKEMLGNPDVIIIDVRQPGDWDSSKLKIKGAVREDPGDISSWMNKYPKDKILIFYCA